MPGFVIPVAVLPRSPAEAGFRRSGGAAGKSAGKSVAISEFPAAGPGVVGELRHASRPRPVAAAVAGGRREAVGRCRADGHRYAVPWSVPGDAPVIGKVLVARGKKVGVHPRAVAVQPASTSTPRSPWLTSTAAVAAALLTLTCGGLDYDVHRVATPLGRPQPDRARDPLAAQIAHELAVDIHPRARNRAG